VKLASGAIVADEKVRDYLLNPDNLQNGGKAGLFGGFGFHRNGWLILAAALRQHPVDNEVIAETVSPHGTKYVVRCHISSPDGRNPCVTSVWIVDAVGGLPRLVTAF
jgi:hypothetical protein